MYPSNSQVGSQFPSETIIVEDADPVKEYFNEVSGRFGGASTSSESEDSFQIVLNDAPRQRRISDSDSEDSFIVFEKSPDGCYTSNEVLEEDSDSEERDASAYLEASSSKSVSKLANDSLPIDQSKDEVDCAIVSHVTVCESVDLDATPIGVKTGLLIDDKKKLLRKDSPAKKVHFSEQSPKVRVMRVWSFAARQARMGPWDMYARDRDRFRRRIHHVGQVISWIFNKEHRHKVICYRIVTWVLSKQKIELQDPKAREAQQKSEWEQALSAIAYDDKQKEQEDERRRDEEKKEKEEQDRLKWEEAMKFAVYNNQKEEDVLKPEDDQEDDTKGTLNVTKEDEETQDKLKWEDTLRALGYGKQTPSDDQEGVSKESCNNTEEARDKLKWEETLRALGYEMQTPSDDQEGDSKESCNTTEETKEAQDRLKLEEAMRFAGFENQKEEEVLKVCDNQKSNTKESFEATEEKKKVQDKHKEALRMAGLEVKKPSDNQGDTKESINPTEDTKEAQDRLKWEEAMRFAGFENQKEEEVLKVCDNQKSNTKGSFEATEEKKMQDKHKEALRMAGLEMKKPSDNQGDTKESSNPTEKTKEAQDKLKWEETMRALGYEKQKPSDNQEGDTKESFKAAEEKKKAQDKLKWEEAMRALDF